jgi:hypothetical protein
VVSSSRDDGRQLLARPSDSSRVGQAGLFKSVQHSTLATVGSSDLERTECINQVQAGEIKAHVKRIEKFAIERRALASCVPKSWHRARLSAGIVQG